MSLCVSKKENRDKVLSKFVVFTVQDEDGGFAKPSRHIMFEEQMFPGAVDILKKYRMKDDRGNEIKDAKGGYPINLKALKESEDADLFKGYFRIPGGMVEYYHLKKGECYANDVDGNRIRDKQGNYVTKSVIPAFVQVKFYIVGANGEMIPHYANGMGLEEVGDRLERQFYREAVATAATPAPSEAATAPETADPF
jgi:hypothetical protein